MQWEAANFPSFQLLHTKNSLWFTTYNEAERHAASERKGFPFQGGK